MTPLPTQIFRIGPQGRVERAGIMYVSPGARVGREGGGRKRKERKEGWCGVVLSGPWREFYSQPMIRQRQGFDFLFEPGFNSPRSADTLTAWSDRG